MMLVATVHCDTPFASVRSLRPSLCLPPQRVLTECLNGRSLRIVDGQ